MPSNYKFTSPIRYFKANDPYYYEIDNIPLRQLEENVLYLKNKIEGRGGGSGGGDKGSVYLSDIIDLKAYLKGGRTISVNPGKFIARINSVNKAKMDLLGRISVNETSIGKEYISELVEQEVSEFLQILLGTSGSPALGFNGLETSFGFYSHTPDNTLSFGKGNDGIPKQTTSNIFPMHLGYPVLQGGGISRFSNIPLGPLLPKDLLTVHKNFVQQWATVFRTALVSVDDDLLIDIPPVEDIELFIEHPNNSTDKDEGNVQQRIDLLFVYAVPVDCSGANIADYSETAHEITGLPNVSSTNPIPKPKNLVKPQLGLVRGAGMGIKRAANFSFNTLKDTFVAPGKPKILQSISDYNNVGPNSLVGTKVNGVTVRGSFPSPDDLLNLAPALVSSGLISFQGEEDETLIPNIGQSVLPIAYIVSRKDQFGLVAEDIIDIRPFFRTTELTYNERVGIAAASPPLSFANPVATKYDVEKLRQEIFPPTVPGSIQSPINTFHYLPSQINLVKYKMQNSPHISSCSSGPSYLQLINASIPNMINGGQLVQVSMDGLNQYSQSINGPGASIPVDAKALIIDSYMSIFSHRNQGSLARYGGAIMFGSGEKPPGKTLFNHSKRMVLGVLIGHAASNDSEYAFSTKGNTTILPIVDGKFYIGIGARKDGGHILYDPLLLDDIVFTPNPTYPPEIIWSKVVGYYR